MSICLDCHVRHEPHVNHRCDPECTQCGRRFSGRQFERDGYLFCCPAHRAEWSRIDAVQEPTIGPTKK